MHQRLHPFQTWFFILALGFSSPSHGQGAKPIQLPLVSSPSISISSLIYGMGVTGLKDPAWPEIKRLRPGVIRFGGNGSERFNDNISAWNSGADAHFENSGSSERDFTSTYISRVRALNVDLAFTLPALGWIAKDRTSKGKIGDSDPANTSLLVTESYLVSLIRKVSERMGEKQVIFILGNEPMQWNSTHQDIHPEPATYREVRDKFLNLARIVRKVAPTARIAGPAVLGWLGTQESAFDKEGMWSKGHRGLDRKAHNDEPFLAWFSKEVKAASVGVGSNGLIDFVDVHFYPENAAIRQRGVSEDPIRSLRIRSTQALWDPKYKDDGDRGVTALIPAMKASIGSPNESIRTAIGEYSFRGDADISGALAQLEVFATLAREKVGYACYGGLPQKGSMIYEAFRLWRNPFDDDVGMESEWVTEETRPKADIAVFLTRNAQKDHGMAMVLNESAQPVSNMTFEWDGKWKVQRGARLSAEQTTVKPLVTIAQKGSQVTLDLPPWSATVLELLPRP